MEGQALVTLVYFAPLILIIIVFACFRIADTLPANKREAKRREEACKEEIRRKEARYKAKYEKEVKRTLEEGHEAKRTLEAMRKENPNILDEA